MAVGREREAVRRLQQDRAVGLVDRRQGALDHEADRLRIQPEVVVVREEGPRDGIVLGRRRTYHGSADA